MLLDREAVLEQCWTTCYFLEGWFAYVKWANTYNLRKKIINSMEEKFAREISTKEINRIMKIQRGFQEH